jgi:signal transduction histidine kinase
VGGPRQGPQFLRDHTGDDVVKHLRNARGSFWVSAPGTPTQPPIRRDTTRAGLIDVMHPSGPAITAEVAVSGTPWMVVLQTPVRSVRARAWEVLLTLIGISVVLAALGAVLSWAISRRITHPLASLTDAAAAIAGGNYGRRVDVAEGARAGDELGRLAASFNQMASEVEASRDELEQQVEEAQAAAEEAEQANSQLHEAMLEAEEARADAEQANRAKGDFLAVMSHELRTPLNAIGGYAQLLEMGVHGLINDAQRDALARISRSQARLLTLINDVLNFAKLDAGRVQYSIDDVPLHDAIAELEPMVAPQVGAKGLRLSYAGCDPALTVRADREKLQQIVLNLVTNAIKFTPEGGLVSVECEPTGETLRIHIRDTGVGIPRERLRSIFDPFVQGDRALHRPNDGVGLGLAISRDLARGMGGDLEVQSTPGFGSTFTLTLARGGAQSSIRLPEPPRVGGERAGLVDGPRGS